MIRRFLCRLVGHNWGRWNLGYGIPPPGFFGGFSNTRQCLRCGHWEEDEYDNNGVGIVLGPGEKVIVKHNLATGEATIVNEQTPSD